MPTELHFLHGLLVVAVVVAPWVTSRFFLQSTKVHDALHVVAGSLVIAALLLDVPVLSFAWPIFCVSALLLFLRQRFTHLRSVYEIAKCVPFAFAIIGATWLAAGANDLRLLGYGEAFSYYAALHGHMLGWMVVGGLSHLANEAERFRPFYLAAVFVCLVSFLLIAFGIDGIPVIKRIGVIGITLIVGVSQLLFLISSRRSPPVVALALVSLGGFLFTIAVAWQNELGAPPGLFAGVRGMVSLHGVVNGLIVAPCFVLALYFNRSGAPDPSLPDP